ncbi:MAG TPA: hemerythrin domain-containing protein [Nitrososphaera sp.]|nr:hemerythrin domain-containing protein [Nitrososphaera sp.]
MSSTESLRRDHNLIEKVLRALTVTADMLKTGRAVPAPIINQSIEFTKNFMLVCHHSKEEDTLFPTLERHGMPKEGGPIARMIFEHGIAKDLAGKMEASSLKYLQSNDPSDLISDIQNYVEHVSAHLTKENFRLFMMADMILKANADAVNTNLAQTEQSRLSEIGQTREHYEQLVADIESGTASSSSSSPQ